MDPPPTAMLKPGDMNALAAAAAKLSVAGDSSSLPSARRDRRRDYSPEVDREVKTSHREQDRDDKLRRDDSPLRFDDSPVKQQGQPSHARRDDLEQRDMNQTKREESQRDESPLRFDDSPIAPRRRSDQRDLDHDRQDGRVNAADREDRPAAGRQHRGDQSRQGGSANGVDQQGVIGESPRLFRAKTAVPQELSFVVPPGCRAGQPVCVQGPHGPIRVPLPQGYQPGEQCSIRFGPTLLHQVAVPQGYRPGDVVKFEGADGEQLEAMVPPGKEPGDFFEVSPPVLMVQVPEGAGEGDQVCFTNHVGVEVRAKVPKGIKPNQYFAARIDCC